MRQYQPRGSVNHRTQGQLQAGRVARKQAAQVAIYRVTKRGVNSTYPVKFVDAADVASEIAKLTDLNPGQAFSA